MWRSSASRKRLKSEAARASCQACWPERVGVADLGGELGRHARRLLVVAPDGGEQADVVGVRVLAGGPRLERVEQPPDLGVDQLVVG